MLNSVTYICQLTIHHVVIPPLIYSCSVRLSINIHSNIYLLDRAWNIKRTNLIFSSYILTARKKASFTIYGYLELWRSWRLGSFKLWSVDLHFRVMRENLKLAVFFLPIVKNVCPIPILKIFFYWFRRWYT